MSAADGLQYVVHDQASRGLYYDLNHPDVVDEDDNSAALSYNPQKSGTIRGMKRKLLTILAVVLIIVIFAGAVWGVGGALAVKNKLNAESHKT